MVSHTNRHGKTYYLHAAPTRRGGVRYVFKRDPQGAVDSVPAGYEVAENVNGRVSLRQIRPRCISEAEEQQVHRELERLRLRGYQVEVKDKHLTVFEPCNVGQPNRLVAEMRRLGLPVPRDLEDPATRGPFSPIMRFTLEDEQRRLFEVCRMCFRGGDDGWIPLDLLPLERAATKYLPYLGKESFFDLI